MGFPSFLLSFFLVFHLLLSSSSSCPSSFNCGPLGRIKYPFTINTYPEVECGLCALNCSKPVPEVVLGEGGTSYQVIGFANDTIKVRDPMLQKLIESHNCDFSRYINIPQPTPSISFTISTNLTTFFKCTNSPFLQDQIDKHFSPNYTRYRGCPDHTFYYSYPNNTVPPKGNYLGYCERFQLPVVSSVENRSLSDPFFSLLASEFPVQYLVSKECRECLDDGGACPRQNQEFHCLKETGASFDCGRLGPLKFPFTNDKYPLCGWCLLRCDEPVPEVILGEEGTSYQVSGIDDTIKISDRKLKESIKSKDCDIFSYIIPPNTPISFTISANLTFFKCPTGSPAIDNQTDEHFFDNYTSYTGCKGHTVYYLYQNNTVPTPGSYPGNCEFFQLPVVSSVVGRNLSDPFSLLTSDFSVEYHLLFPSPSPPISPSSNVPKERGRSHLGLILGIVIPGVILFASLLILIIWYHKKWRNSSSDPFSKEDLEEGNAYFGIPVFSYSELKEATHNFDPSQELGDGGFGTVYHGKLQDGREVAVKRLYQHNYKRVAQFLNEIEILTHLRHPNLVTLYGCTSRRSRELLLVYEYIPNGTVADHLNGDRAKDHPLPWPIRMKIAIETASALVYLHASEIIHRDVKTNNILLDNNFCVKVADFGLSRLFPTDASHVSTAPQGTPGYVDPDYHQCYQLTDKSDVYSFGVVLIELISSLPAVDISRHRHEINLANLAISRIQDGAFNELIDPALGFNSDSSVERMTTAVAEVAFRCLQLEKEMRPRMNEVLEALKEIQEYKDDEIGEMPPPSPDGANDELLNSSKVPPSQDSVTNGWFSSSTASISTV